MTLSWDFFITMFFVVMTVYGMLLGKGRVFAILVNTYVGYVIAGEMGEIIFQSIKKAAFINNPFATSYFGAKLLTFAGVIFLLTLKGELSGYDDKGMQSSFMTAVYGFLASGLILSSIFSFMGETERSNIVSVSKIASQVVDNRMLWLVGPIGAVIIGSFLRGRSSSR